MGICSITHSHHLFCVLQLNTKKNEAESQLRGQGTSPAQRYQYLQRKCVLHALFLKPEMHLNAISSIALPQDDIYSVSLFIVKYVCSIITSDWSGFISNFYRRGIPILKVSIKEKFSSSTQGLTDALTWQFGGLVFVSFFFPTPASTPAWQVIKRLKTHIHHIWPPHKIQSQTLNRL